MDYDIAIIGGGLLGCFTARNLSRYNWRIAVFEKNTDVCTEMSKANTAVIYPGYDTSAGSLKLRLSLEANRNFEELCGQLGVRFHRPGSLMVSFGKGADEVIRNKYENGLKNGVPGLRLLSARETRAAEPHINPAVRSALFAETTATVNPWELGIAAAENAFNNGAEFFLNSQITGIKPVEHGYELNHGGGKCTARAVVNCAGLHGDEVSELVNKPRFRIDTSSADYLMLDESENNYVNHIVMHEPEPDPVPGTRNSKPRGASLIPTVDGNILIGTTKIKTSVKTGYATSREGCELLGKMALDVFPELPLDMIIRSFASIRPSVRMVDCDENGKIVNTGERLRDLLIYETENPGFINLAGIKTPGLTCCNEIGKHVSDMLLDVLGNPGRNPEFNPRVDRIPVFARLSHKEREALAAENPDYGKIVCRCRKITEAEIRGSIRRSLGASALDGVKRRAGVGMGRCQGGFCTQRVLEILADELQRPIAEILKNNPGSEMIS